MSNKSLKFQYRIIVLLFSFGLFAILQANLPEQALIQAAPSPQDEILQAWELAEDSGAYEFKTQVEQTTYPAPSLANVGATSVTDRFSLDGDIDRPEETMTLTLFPNGNRTPNNGLALHIDGETAYGLKPDGQWEALEENPGDIFAPGGDPLGYLAAAKNIRFLDTQADGLNFEHRQYAFDFDGEAFADFVRLQMEQQMQERGSLPQGMHLSAPDVYHNTSGDGHIWLDEAGLPSRMSATLNLPPEANGEKISVVIQTDFYSFDHERIAIAQASPLTNGYTWATSTIFLPENLHTLQTTGIQLSIAVVFASLFLILISSSLKHKREFVVALNLSLIIAMLFTPLLQSQQASAFHEERLAESTANAAQTAEQERVEAATAAQKEEETWNPQQNPLVQNEQEDLQDQVASINFNNSSIEAVSAPAQQNDDPDFDTTDTDGDGLIDAIEIWIDSDINDVDTDGDGLTDGTEYHTLGTDAVAEDSDGDSIPDLKEVEGFFHNGQQWYLNPLKGDSNGDGLTDGQECEPYSLLVENGTGDCGDHDNDGTPDVFDFDNDNDGVPDKIDISPNQFLGDSGNFFDEENPFAFSIDNLTADEPTLVQFQLRPVDENQLYYSNSILDWPTFDLEGQIQRRDDTTWANTPNQAIRINAANASNGDVIVTPKLEIFVPHDSTYYANLPTLDTITDTVNIAGWLDTTKLDPFGISVRQINDDGDLNIYVPLNSVVNEESGEIVALSAQTLYWPTATGWGADHDVRLVWMVQTIVNDFYDSTDESRVIHIYKDESWTITGLNVREDHGFDIALIAEDPDVDPDLEQDDDILNLASNLSLSFTEGIDCVQGTDPDDDCTISDERMTLVDIYDRFNHTTNGSATDGERWFMSDTFVVDPHSYDHMGYVAQVAMTDTIEFLGNVYDNHTDMNPVVLFAREETSKNANMDLLEGSLNPDNAFVLDMADRELIMTASLQAAAFRHVIDQSDPNPNSNWQSYPLEEYLVYLGEKLADHPDFLPDDPNDQESLDIAEGKIMVAQIYLMSLNAGVVNIVEVDNEPWLAVEEYYNEKAYLPHSTTSWASLAGSLLYEAAYYSWWKVMPGAASSGSIVKATSTAWYKAWPKAVQAKMMKFYGYVKTAGGNIKQGDGNLKWIGNVPVSRLGKGAISVVLVAVLVITVWALVTNLTNSGGMANVETVAIIMSGLSAAVTAVLIINIINQAVRAVQLASTQMILGYATTMGVIRQVTSSARSGSVVGVIMSVLFTWGILLYYLIEGNINKYGKRALIAYGVAATILAILLFLISIIPGIGIFIVLLITLFDAVAFIICAALDSDKPICKGITGLFTEALAELFYSAEALVDLGDPSRVNLNIKGPTLSDPELGFTVDNAVTYTATVGVFLGPYNFTTNWYEGFENTPDGEFAEKSSFSYILQQGEIDHHSELGWNDVDWIKDVIEQGTIGDDEYGYLRASFAPDPLTIDFAESGTGINVPLGNVYLSESYRVPIKECSLDRCWADEKEDGTVHINIGSLLYFDIIPSTLDEFMAVTEKDDGYAQAWGQTDTGSGPYELTFPRLKDADNDGLRHVLDGGSDPNDNDWDTDDDGLSDFREHAIGTNPEDADTDNDSLTDYEEVRHGSNPLKADEDADGLGDAIEVEGWLIGYLGIDGNVYQTRVWSDPSIADIDNDGFLDVVEFTYGLNPNSADDSDVVNNALIFDGLRVDEVGTPLLLLPFDETGGPAFNDESGNANVAICKSEDCPTAYVTGRYGPGIQFDGSSEFLTVDDIDLANKSFTVSAWAKRDGNGRNEYIFSQGTTSTNRGLHIGFRGNDSFTCAFYSNDLNTSSTYTDSDWHHWACTYDANDNLRTIYRDGVQVAQDNASANYQGSGLFNIGRRDLNSNKMSFGGSVDEVVVYDRALAVDEVANLQYGRYHLNDLIVSPDTNLTYQVTAENSLLGRTASGHFYTEPESELSPLIVSDELQSFTLEALESVTLSGSVDVDGSASNGVYPLNLTAEGAVNATESALFLSLPDPEMGIYFETNQFGNTPNDDVPLSLGNVIEATCPPPTRYGSQSCPTFVDGLNGRGLEVNGTDEAVLIESTSNNSELDLIDGDFTMGAWVYPTHDETDTTNRAVLGYYDPDQLWFDFRDNDGNTAFYDEAGVFSATCSGSACPTSDVHNNRFDGVDDRLSIANTSNLNLQTVEHMSLIMDFSIPRQIPEGQGGSIIDNMVLYEQGGGTAGLNIYADSHGGLGSQMHVCAWDLGGNPYSYGPNCVDFVVKFPGIGRRLIVTFDGGNPLAGFGNSGNMKVYLDGELQGSADVYDIRSHSNGIGIGGVNGDTRLQTGTINGGANFEGTMTTLAFFPTTFNEDEVQFYNDNHFGEVFPTLFVSGTNVGMAFEDDDGTHIYNETPPGYFGLQPNKWSHVAMTYDAFNEQVTLYHNGIQIDSESIQLTTPALDKQQFRLGWAGGPFDNFEGSIDSVVFYDEVLTGDEIADVASFIFNENASLHYEFDEVPGSSEFQYGYDESEFGTCSGSSCPTSGLRGQINWATSFDGDDYIEGNLPNSTDTMLDHFSISTWVQASGVGTIFEYNHSSNNHRILLRTDRFVVDNGSRIDANFGGSGGVTNSEWHHLVATFDSADSARIYLNGVEFASKAMNGNPIEIEALGAIRIGKGLRINDEFALNGSLDDLRFYETTLTSNQVTDLYERTAPVVHFRFDEDELATQVFDASPNEFIGEVRNAQPGVEGRLGNAVRFTHDSEIVNNSQVLIQEIAELGGVSSNFTIMTWIKSDDFRDSGPDTIMSWEHSALRINHSTDTKNFQLHGSDVPTGEHPQNLGEWEHLAISADSNGNLRYYLNGVLIQTATFGQDSFIDELSLGEEAGDPAGGVKDSTLDEFAFYNRALSSLEIADQYRIDSRWYRSVGTFRITVDTDAPTVELRSYTPYWQNQSTVLDVMTSDGTTAVTLVDMGIRLLGPTTELAWQGAPACEDAELGVAWCPTFDPTQLDGEGIYELVFRAVDAAGNETTSSSYFFLVDDTGPEISGNNSGTFGSPVRINYNEWYIPLDGTGSDPKIGTSGGSGLKTDSVMVALYEEDGDMAGAGLQTATVVDGNWSVDYLFNGRRPNGQYSIEVSAMDELGNITVATLGTLHIDGHSSRIDLYAEAGENENIPPDTQAPPAIDIANSGIGVVPSELLTAVHTLNGTVSDLPELAGARLNLHFEEVAGTDVYLDSSGWEHTATCTNCPTATSGFFGQALDFDGTNDVVNIAGTNSLNIGPELTLSAWVNPDVVPTTGIANLVSLGADKAVIRIDNGDLHFYMNLDGALHHIRVGGVLITDQYQHVAGTYNGQTLRLYHNGILVGSVDATGEVDDSSSVMINSSSDSFDGQMDEIMIFDRALFEHEVYNLAQSTLAAIASVETSFELLGDGSYLVDLPLPDGAKFYLPFNENRVDEAGDRITSFADYSGTGQSAGCVLSRCPDADAEGQDGSGLFFDRFDNFLSITTNLIDPGADQFTAAAWFNVDEIGVGDQVILSQANIAGNGTGQNWLGIRDNGVPYTFLDGNFLQGTEVISTGQWHHVAVMYDGAMLSLYVNGQLAATSASTLVSSDGELRIGVSNTGGNYFGGGIDELALFDRALALSELRQLMTDGRSILTVDFDEAYAVNGDVLTLNSVLPLTAQLVSDGSSNLIAPGQVGSGALTLDGNGDYTAVSSSPFLDLSHGEYSQLVWIYPEPTDNNTYPIISSGASSSVEESYPFIELVEQTKLRVGFGDGTSMTSFTTDSVLTANAWNQVGVTFDGDTMRIFVNGVEVTSTTTLSGLAPYPTQQFDIGRDDNGFFKGQIDDVQIYQRPLTAVEIAEQYRSAAWQAVSLDQPDSNLSTWSQVLPEVEGVYRINSRSTDGFNNISESFPLWEGFVDTLGPRITISSVLTGDGAAAQTEYTYTVTDYHLDDSSIVGPCADPNPMGSPFESRWYRSDFGIVNPADAPITSISGVCQVDGHHPDPVTLEACDLYDNCAIGESTSENNLPTPDDESLIALWVIEEGSGTITADTSGNGNDGVLNGDMVWSSDTPSGSGYTLEFDGVNDYVEIPNESQFDLNVMSVAFWVKVDAFTTNWQAMVTKGDGAWRIHRCGSNQTISFGTSGLSNGDMCSNATFDDGQWHHVVAVYDGSTKSLYVDGALDKSEAVTGSINTNDYPVMIGNNAQRMTRYFDGLIDEVRIYDKALSADEITALALASPLASWTFEEGSGTTAVDVTGNGHDGTLNGQIAWSTDTENGSSYALEFDGVDDYVEIPNESDFDLNVLSVAFWVKVDAFTTNWQGMVTKGDGAWRVHRCNAAQTISFGTSGLSNKDMCSNTTFNDGQWHHVVAVYDGSTKSLYVDGVLDTSLAVTGSVNTNDYPVMIGDNAQRGGRNFGGWIDDVKIYDQALSDSEVNALYNVGSNPLAGTAAGGFPSAGTIALMLLVMAVLGWLAWKRPWRRRYQAG